MRRLIPFVLMTLGTIPSRLRLVALHPAFRRGEWLADLRRHAPREKAAHGVKRLIGLGIAGLLAGIIIAPVALAADPPSLPHTGRVVISTEGDFTLPAGEHADVVVVVNGTATILGEVSTVVAIDGAANLVGARTETVVAVRSPVELGQDTVVQGDVLTYESPVHQTGNAEVLGSVDDLATVLLGIGAVLAPAFILLWIGFALAMLAAGLLLAGLAPRQVREAEAIISERPVGALVAGIVGLIVFPALSIILVATLVGAPLGFGILFQVWPLLAFLGYLVAGTWVGDWVLRRSAPDREREKPYLAAIVGLVALGLLSVVPVLSIVTAFASLVGFGAVLLLSLAKLTSRPTPRPSVPGALPASAAG
jgi:hypothetical protein